MSSFIRPAAQADSISKKNIFNIRISAKTLLYAEILYALFVNFFISVLGAPYALIYVLDILNVATFTCSLGRIKETFSSFSYHSVVAAFYVFCIVLLFSDVLNQVSPTPIVWALRKTFRFFLFFVSCVVILNEQDSKKMCKCLLPLQFLNIGLALFEYFVLKKSQDNLGGIFGTASGCNGYLNAFFLILLCYFAIYCLSGKESIWKLVFVCVSTLAIAGMAELKFYYIEFLIVMVVCCFIYLKKVRAFIIAFFSVVSLLAGFWVFAQIFPDAAAQLLDFDALFKYSSEGMAGYELSRFGSFSEISHMIFNDDFQECLLGIGFGNAEFSASIPMFTSSFYHVWGFLNYRWFAHQMWFIETGYLGFISFVLLFVGHFFFCLKGRKRFPQHKESFSFIALFTLVTIGNFWYNCAIRVESAYMIFLVLSFACVSSKTAGEVSNEV